MKFLIYNSLGSHHPTGSLGKDVSPVGISWHYFRSFWDCLLGNWALGCRDVGVGRFVDFFLARGWGRGFVLRQLMTVWGHFKVSLWPEKGPIYQQLWKGSIRQEQPKQLTLLLLIKMSLLNAIKGFLNPSGKAKGLPGCQLHSIPHTKPLFKSPAGILQLSPPAMLPKPGILHVIPDFPIQKTILCCCFEGHHA